MTGTYEPETKSSLWCGAVGVSEVKVERAGSLCSSYCPVDLVPLGLAAIRHRADQEVRSLITYPSPVTSYGWLTV